MAKDGTIGMPKTAELRNHAEERMQGNPAELPLPELSFDTQRLCHELQVHQTELMIQNEELCNIRDELEAALDQYTNLYDFAPVGYFSLDPIGTILRVNLSGALLIGEKRSRLVGGRFGYLVRNDDRATFNDFLRKVFSSQDQVECEVALLKEGISPFYAQIKGVVAESGKECRLALIDLTERKQSEEKSREKEVQYRALFENSMDAIFLSDSNGIISSANPAACTLFQMTEEEFRCAGRDGIMNPSDLRLQAALDKRGASGKVRGELTAIRKDGTIFPVEVSSVFFTDSCRSFVVVRDLTEQKRVEVDLREKEQLLLHQSRLAAMGEMINNIAHQWRQPLNSLGLIIQQMQLNYDYEELTRENINDIARKSMRLIHHMSQTIDDFAHYFQTDKERVGYSIQEVVTKTLNLVENSLIFQHIRIAVNVSANPILFGFPNEYSQVLLNIIMNAKDALSDSHRDDAEITINISKEGERSLVTIADNGGGVPKEIIGKIFEPYFTTKGPNKGTGIGLFMSKTIIEKHMGGHLTVRNFGEGAEFRIEV